MENKEFMQSNKKGDNIANYYGLSYFDTKELILDVYRSNAYRLAQEAADIAEARVMRVVNKLLEQIYHLKPEAINTFNEPIIQYMLANLTKIAASNPTDEFDSLTIKLAIEYITANDDGIDKLMINEALKILSKTSREVLVHIQILNFFLNVSNVKKNRESFIYYKQLISEILRGKSFHPIFRYMEDINLIKSPSTGIRLSIPLEEQISSLYEKLRQHNYYSLTKNRTSIEQALKNKILDPKEREKIVNTIMEILDKELVRRNGRYGYSSIIKMCIIKKVEPYLKVICITESDLQSHLELEIDDLRIFNYIIQYNFTSVGAIIARNLPDLLATAIS